MLSAHARWLSICLARAASANSQLHGEWRKRRNRHLRPFIGGLETLRLCGSAIAIGIGNSSVAIKHLRARNAVLASINAFSAALSPRPSESEHDLVRDASNRDIEDRTFVIIVRIA
jgi:hypothetical protein